MNDRFKFRAWDDTYKRFVFRTLIDAKEASLVWEQCTGLKDKNGRLIYEGDIVQDCEQKIKVVFDEEKHCFMFKYQKTHAYKPIYCLDVLDGDFEVIGNIHENPELLEE